MITFHNLERQGRLGNQLWQIAGTMGIGISRGVDVILPATWSYRSFFNIPDSMFGDPNQAEDSVQYALSIEERSRPYLQDYSLWADYEDIILEYFSPSDLAKSILDEVGNEFSLLKKPVLSVHVRRGDNVPGADPWCLDKHLYHPLRPLSYYLEGIELAQAASIAVFSDDIAWCRENIPGDYYHVGVTRAPFDQPAFATDPVLDWIDLMLMARCDYHVISNSSYAWWGAFLSGDRSVIYPSPWYGTNLSYIDADAMFPPTWRKLMHSL